jgi:Helix-turn-helix domain
MPGGPKSDADREKAVIALLSCHSIKEAAHESGVSYKTLRTWLAEDEDFKALYAQARQEALEQAISRLHELSGAAVEVLRKAMRSNNPAVATRAAVAVLDRAIRGGELLDLVKRIEELERRVKSRRGK